MGRMVLVERSFQVRLPVETAWAVLARVEEWPRWAGHIRRVEHRPEGPLGPGSSGRIHLRGAPSSTFRMAQWEPWRHWTWSGPFLWIRVLYDHRFEPGAEGATRLTWVVEGEGAGVGTVGRLFGAVYARNLDRAIPRFVAWAEAQAVSGG